MKEIKCPKCESTSIYTYNPNGDIEQNYYEVYGECKLCDVEFIIKAEFCNIEIEEI